MQLSHYTVEQIVSLVAGELDSGDLYFGHGTDNAWDEACWLTETLVRRRGLPLQPDAVLPADLLEELETLLLRRIKDRVPLAYLLQEAWFAGLPFHVDERVLVPRSPIAELIENGFSPFLQKPPQRILDLCTGSGCIGIAAALRFPDAQVVLSDVSAAALQVCEINIQRYELEDRVRAVQADLFSGIEGQFDLILCNPPYVGEAEYSALPSEYQAEPQLGLLCDNNGLSLPLSVLQEAGAHLAQDGVLILEVGNSWEALAAAAPDIPFLWLDFEHGGHGVCALQAAQLP